MLATGLAIMKRRAGALRAAQGTAALRAIVRWISDLPWLLGLLVATAGFVLLQNSFHWARGIIAMPLSSALSNLVPIVGGIVAFGEKLPSDTASALLRVGTFVLTILASLLVAGAEITLGNECSARPASAVHDK